MVLAALGIALGLSGEIAGHNCLDAYHDCVANSGNNASQCQTLVHLRCGLEVYQSLIAAGVIIVAFGLPTLTSYFCCCSSPPPAAPSLEAEGPYHIVVEPSFVPVAPPAAREYYTWQAAEWQQLQLMRKQALLAQQPPVGEASCKHPDMATAPVGCNKHATAVASTPEPLLPAAVVDLPHNSVEVTPGPAMPKETEGEPSAAWPTAPVLRAANASDSGTTQAPR